MEEENSFKTKTMAINLLANRLMVKLVADPLFQYQNYGLTQIEQVELLLLGSRVPLPKIQQL